MKRSMSRKRTVGAGIAFAASIASVTMIGAPAVSADPGDAAAVGIRSTLDVTLLDGTTTSVNGSIGAVSAPPSESSELTGNDASLGDPDASASATTVRTEANSSPTGSSASSEVTGATVDVPGLDPLIGDTLFDTNGQVITAAADCPTDGTPTATVGDITDATVGDEDVAFDQDGNATVTLSTTDGSSGTVDLQVDRTAVTTETAIATAIELNFDVELGDGLTTTTVTGSVVIAEAGCQTPVAASAPTATSIDPDEGPTAGGTTVTIEGTDFVPDETTVTIGGNTVPATEVTVADDGESLTFVTPSHPKGLVGVTVTAPGGTTEPLDYTYVPPEAGAPTVTTIDPDEGPTSGGTTVTIEGSDFVPGETTVTIGGTTIPADEVTVGDGGSSLTFTTPPHVAGPVGVTVTTPDGRSGSLDYTYVGTPDNDDDDDGNGNDRNDDGNRNDRNDDGNGNGNRNRNGANGARNASNTGALPRTGSDLGTLALYGTLVMLGGAGVLASRRRLMAARR